VPVLRPVVDEQQQPGRRQALDEAIQQRLGLGVDPVQVLDEQQERLYPLSRSRRPVTASSVRRRRCEGSRRSQAASSTGTSSRASSADRAGSRARSSERTFPVTFSRIVRVSSRRSIWKYTLSRSMTGRYGVVLP